MKLIGKKPNPYKIAEEICKHHELLFDKRLIILSGSNINMDITNDITLIIVIESKRKNDVFYYYNTKTYNVKNIQLKPLDQYGMKLILN